jgi:hypothetical protein
MAGTLYDGAFQHVFVQVDSPQSLGSAPFAVDVKAHAGLKDAPVAHIGDRHGGGRPVVVVGVGVGILSSVPRRAQITGFFHVGEEIEGREGDGRDALGSRRVQKSNSHIVLGNGVARV